MENKSNHYILEHILKKTAIPVSYRKALKTLKPITVQVH